MTLRYPFDLRTQVGVEQALWHADPVLEAFIRDIFERAQPDIFVETGSHMGWTSEWVARNYPHVEVQTVEVDAEFYQRASENLAPYPNAHIAHDDSANWLWKLLPSLQQRLPLFWLDAHWHPPVPLREECRIFQYLSRYICLIDDFQCWAPDFSGDTLYARRSLDYTKDGADGGGDKYHNDLSYTSEAMTEWEDDGISGQIHPEHYRPNYEAKPGNRGVGCFVSGRTIALTHDSRGLALPQNYVPPPTWRRESHEQFLASRPASAYPLHPSFRLVTS